MLFHFQLCCGNWGKFSSEDMPEFSICIVLGFEVRVSRWLRSTKSQVAWWFQSPWSKTMYNFFQVEMNLSCALLLCFLHFMALMCAGMKSITSIMAFVLSFCRAQAIAGGCVPPNAVQCIAVSLDSCWAGGAWMLAAAGRITVSSQFPAAPWADATVRKSVHAASHEMYQVLHVAREISGFRHNLKSAFCSVC